jgi:hypothetical protein
VLIRHVSRQLARYCDDQLDARQTRRVEMHLAACERCRRERDEIRFAAGVMRRLAVVSPPASLWRGIAATLDAPAPKRSWLPMSRLALASALASVLVAAAAAFWVADRVSSRPWQVARFDGAGMTTRLAEGEWVETDPSSRARITVGQIGTVDVEPATRVQLGAVRRDAYRMTLARGTISARISAPPRLFVVDTPASTVVDLGCAYTVEVDDQGRGDLHVTEGWASLEWNGRESLVPAGASCPIRPRVGPGTPAFDDAPADLRAALVAFDFADGGARAISTVLAAARVRDTLTLWHLLSRVAPPERERVYDRIGELVPPPQTVSRVKALQLDPDTLTRLREELAWKW